MVQGRHDSFAGDLAQLADYAKALAHPARIRILKVLAQKNTSICGEIVDLLPLSQSTVSQHLKVLKEAGLICGTIEGPKVCYCLNWKAVKKASDGVSELFSTLLKVKKNKQ